jgi:glycerol-1-phosphate dehydrogenase [NAD(P)+]
MFGHFWDIAAINDNRSHPLHGISVGVASYVSALIAQELKEHLPEGVMYPTPEEIREKLEAIDAPTSPKELGISPREFNQSMIHAWENKPHKYSILHLMRDLGKSEELAAKLIEKFY